MVVLPMASQNTAFAQCKAKASCSVGDDTGSSPICESETYDPCDNLMLWDVYFTRTDHQGQPYTTLICVIENSGWNRSYTSQWYAPEESFHFEGSAYIGSSTNHRIVIYRSGATGNYTDITVAAQYVADDPTK